MLVTMIVTPLAATLIQMAISRSREYLAEPPVRKSAVTRNPWPVP